jgi:hypothetical protein
MAEVKALRPATEVDALEIIRRAGSVESVTALVAMLGWERTKTQRWLARRQQDGDIMLKPSGPGGKTMIEAARTPAQPPTEPGAQQSAQLAQVTAHPNSSPDAPPARVDAHQDAHPPAFDPVAIRVDRQLAQPNAQVVSPKLVVERPARHLTAAAWVLGVLSIALSLSIYVLSTILNMSFWAALNPDMTIKQILAAGGLCFEFANFVGPSAISFAPRSYPGLRRIVWAILCGTMGCCLRGRCEGQPGRVSGPAGEDQQGSGPATGHRQLRYGARPRWCCRRSKAGRHRDRLAQGDLCADPQS